MLALFILETETQLLFMPEHQHMEQTTKPQFNAQLVVKHQSSNLTYQITKNMTAMILKTQTLLTWEMEHFPSHFPYQQLWLI